MIMRVKHVIFELLQFKCHAYLGLILGLIR